MQPGAEHLSKVASPHKAPLPKNNQALIKSQRDLATLFTIDCLLSMAEKRKHKEVLHLQI